LGVRHERAHAGRRRTLNVSHTPTPTTCYGAHDWDRRRKSGGSAPVVLRISLERLRILPGRGVLQQTPPQGRLTGLGMSFTSLSHRANEVRISLTLVCHRLNERPIDLTTLSIAFTPLSIQLNQRHQPLTTLSTPLTRLAIRIMQRSV
jgi:hypothetical protein